MSHWMVFPHCPTKNPKYLSNILAITPKNISCTELKPRYFVTLISRNKFTFRLKMMSKNPLSTSPFWPIVEKITTTGQATLDENLMKQIKRLCKYVRSDFFWVTLQELNNYPYKSVSRNCKIIVVSLHSKL